MPCKGYQLPKERRREHFLPHPMNFLKAFDFIYFCSIEWSAKVAKRGGLGKCRANYAEGLRKKAKEGEKDMEKGGCMMKR